MQGGYCPPSQYILAVHSANPNLCIPVIPACLWPVSISYPGTNLKLSAEPTIVGVFILMRTAHPTAVSPSYRHVCSRYPSLILAPIYNYLQNHQSLVFSFWCTRHTLLLYPRHTGMFVAGIHLLSWHQSVIICGTINRWCFHSGAHGAPYRNRPPGR